MTRGDTVWQESKVAEAFLEGVRGGLPLAPGGLFLNLEHVSSASPWAGRAFDELCIDGLYAYHRERGGQDSRESVANRFYYRPDKGANILAPVEEQCRWLRDLGFVDVDC